MSSNSFDSSVTIDLNSETLQSGEHQAESPGKSIAVDCAKRANELHAGGGWRGVAPVAPILPGEWKFGMPCHWQESSRRNTVKYLLLRLAHVLQVIASIAYLQYRARKTLAIVTKNPVLVAYQIIFFLFEVVSALSLFVHTLETWKVVRRNTADLKRIPNEFISTPFTHERRADLPDQFSNWPSVAIYIPCYNEDIGLVKQTVVGALGIDYPKELLQIYLCDDGKDIGKLEMISALRQDSENSNVHYFIRPDNSHAKAGNLNYALSRTDSDLIVTLDADFVSRPNLLQRLVPYYYNWNAETSLYEFNSSLGCVQTPQHFRNLSPYDADSIDQRSTLFTDVMLPGKDWFNASTMIGTTNLLGRLAAKSVGYYPVHSVTEDTAMSLAFHSAGYRTYYCNESLAHGLACTNLWSNIGQRARWMKGDWQILFHLKKSPLVVKGLSVAQRLCYLGMSLSRFTSVVNVGYEVGLVLLLVFSISPLDVLSPEEFLYYMIPFIVLGVISRFILVSGGSGLDKSESATVAFEALFRYYVVTGFFVTVTSLLRRKNLEFVVTEKARVEEEEPTKIDQDASTTLVGLAPHMEGGEEEATKGNSKEFSEEVSNFQSRSSVSSSLDSRINISSENDGDDSGKSVSPRPANKFYWSLSPAEKSVRQRDVRKNFEKLWFSVLMAAVLTFAIVWGVLNPPVPQTLQQKTVDGVLYNVRYTSVLPVTLAIGFAGMNIMCYLLGIFLIFTPYTKSWMMKDFVHGRCDQYAVIPKGSKAGKLFVPFSYISLLSIGRGILLLGCLGSLAYYIYGTDGGATVLEKVL